MEKINTASQIRFLTFIIFCTNFVYAVPVTIKIEGYITSTMGSGLPDMIQTGDLFSGYYTYDTSTVDSNAKTDRGNYQHVSPFSFCVSIRGYEFKTTMDQGFEMKIWNNFTDPLGNTYDYYYVESVGIDPVLDIEGIFMNWRLSDDDYNAIFSDDLTSKVPALSDWSHNYFTIGSGDGLPTFFHVTGKVMETAILPEPSTLILLSIGGLLMRKR